MTENGEEVSQLEQLFEYLEKEDAQTGGGFWSPPPAYLIALVLVFILLTLLL